VERRGVIRESGATAFASRNSRRAADLEPIRGHFGQPYIPGCPPVSPDRTPARINETKSRTNVRAFEDEPEGPCTAAAT
jgi:hypothetical protein